MNQSTTMIAIDLFSGGGGFTRGFIQGGIKVVCAVENSPPAIRTYSENFPDVFLFNKDVKKIHSKEIRGVIKDFGEELVVIGGPPCEAFSEVSVDRMKDPLDRLYKDERGRLVLEFIRITGDLNPKVFVMENVPAITDGDLRSALEYEFERVGFNIHFNLLEASKHGCPSRRRRIFISNVKIQLEPSKQITVWDAIKDLPEPGEYQDIPNHEYTPVSKKRRKKIHKLRWGQSLVRFRGSSGKTYTSWTRLHPFKPAPTVKGNSRFIHPFEDRLITVREQARLMGFPDEHVFLGSRDNQYEQVGEAVPPPLAKAIALYLRRCL